ESLRKTTPGFQGAGQCSGGAPRGFGTERGTRRRGMLKHGSSTLRPESLRKTARAFNAPVNVQEGLREDSRRSEERGEGACSNTAPPRSALNPCGRTTGHSTRDLRTMSPSDTAMSPPDTA